MKEMDVFPAAKESVQKCLGRIPFANIERMDAAPQMGGERPDLLIVLRLPEGIQLLVVEIKSSGQPRQAIAAANKLRLLNDVIPGSYGVFVAPYISPTSADICNQMGIGYIDLAGNCRIVFDSVFIQKEGILNPFREKRLLRSLFSPKSERVIRVLLSKLNRKWKIKQLAKEAKVSIGHVSNVKGKLFERNYIRLEKRGFSLIEEEALLAEWSEGYNYSRDKKHYFYSLKTPQEVERDIQKTAIDLGLNYALTSFSGASRLAPMVRYGTATTYVQQKENVDTISGLLELEKVDTGHNVELIEPYDEGVFYNSKDINGFRVVSPIQLYLDLRGVKGRGLEAAEFLFEKVIRPQW